MVVAKAEAALDREDHGMARTGQEQEAEAEALEVRRVQEEMVGLMGVEVAGRSWPRMGGAAALARELEEETLVGVVRAVSLMGALAQAAFWIQLLTAAFRALLLFQRLPVMVGVDREM